MSDPKTGAEGVLSSSGAGAAGSEAQAAESEFHGLAAAEAGEQHHHHEPLVKLLSVNMESPHTWQRVLAVRLPEEEWQQARAKVLVGLKRKVQIPGFRKGKVPKEIVETQFAEQLNMDALEWLLPRAWHQALHEVSIRPVNDPEFSDLEFGEEGGEFAFKATVEVRPEVKIHAYQGVKVTWYKEPEPPDGVERTLESLQESRAQHHEVQRPARDGDRVTVDFRQTEASGVPILGTEVKGHVFELGSPGILPEFSAGVQGMSLGEQRSFPLHYPPDFEQASLAGQVRHFQVTLQKLEEKELPALDDPFAAQLGNFKSLEELRDQIARNITAEVEQRNRRRLETALVQSLLVLNEFELPPSMVTGYVEQLLEDQQRGGGRPLSPEEKREAAESFKPAAEFAIKRWFLLEAVGEQESLSVSDADYETQLERIAQAEGTDLAAVRRRVERARAEGRIREDLLHRKIMAFLISGAAIREEMIAPEAGSRA